MGKRKRGGGNPLTKGLGHVLDKAGGQMTDGIIEVASAGGGSKKSSGSSERHTDWATRAPAPTRQRRSR
ncbi:MAG: hypothetical protein ACRDZ7_12845 [Acidimicrobiia bacterium]